MMMTANKPEPHRLSGIAAALDVMADHATPHGTHLSVVHAACVALAADGTRPTVRAVYAYLMTDQGKAPSFRDLSPVVRRWRAERWKSRSVGRVYLAYSRLDSEQKAAFYERVAADDMGALQPADDVAKYEIKARLRSGDEVIEYAGRKTHAWVRYHNLQDRCRADVVEITVSERHEDGSLTVVRRWRSSR